MSEEQQDHSKVLEERVRQRSELRRRRSLEHLSSTLLHATLESSPHPIIVYENNSISYANPAAIAKLGYTFEQLMTFNDVTLDTGARKERLDSILTPCAKQGWDELDLDLSITTLDKQELRLHPHLRHVRINAADYWIAHITHAEKVNPATLKNRTINALYRVFQRERTYVKAPDYADKEFLIGAIKQFAAPATANLVIDLRRTRGVAEDALPILHEFSKGFKDHLFLINASEEVYHGLKHHKIPSETLYRATKRTYLPAPA